MFNIDNLDIGDYFIDPTMILYTWQENLSIQFDKILLDKLYTDTIKIGFAIDKEKLKKWLALCVRLENIPENELIKLGVEKTISTLKNKNAKLENMVSELQDKIYDLEEQLNAKD